jgi:hypothetical protein
MAETPEQKYNRIAAAVQQTILNNFPNPNRVGCPGDVRVREVAARGTIVEDDDWQHITHCSECYREFLAAKEQLRRSGRRARVLGLVGGTALVILVAAVAGYRYLGERKTPHEIVAVSFEPATLNYRDSGAVRGDGNEQKKEIPVVSRRPLELTVVLPFGSEPGVYQFEFLDSSDRVLKSGDATATLHNGDTTLMTRIDMSSLSPGDYKIGLRRQSFSWVPLPFRVQ